MTWDDEFTCPVCGTDDIVFPAGSESSPILIIGEFPGEVEIKYCKPFVGASGGVLKEELLYLGVDIKQCRRTNLWIHAKNNDAGCLVISAKKAIAEAKKKKAVLLVGSDVVSYFCDLKVMDVNGLQVKSNFISAPIIYACINPAMMFKGGGVGELRFALTNFAKAIEDIL